MKKLWLTFPFLAILGLLSTKPTAPTVGYRIVDGKLEVTDAAKAFAWARQQGAQADSTPEKWGRLFLGGSNLGELTPSMKAKADFLFKLIVQAIAGRLDAKAITAPEALAAIANVLGVFKLQGVDTSTWATTLPNP